MSWSRWDDATHSNKKLLAVSPAARWLHFSAVGECRQLAGKGDEQAAVGVLRQQTARALARSQQIPVEAIDELLEVNYENPLWYAEGDTYRIHDYEVYKPPASFNSTGRVQRHRARVRQEREEAAVNAPKLEVVTEKRRSRHSVLSERTSQVAVWAAGKFGGYPRADQCKRIARFDVPMDALLAHLDQVMADQGTVDPVRSLSWFVRPEGISRLHKLQSEGHASRADTGRREGGVARVGELLDELEEVTG